MAQLSWIRGPVWDLCWIWSSIPIALSVVVMPPQFRVWFFTVALMAETAHRLSPMALVWFHREFRCREVLPNLGWYVGLPVVIMAVAMIVGTQLPPRYLLHTYLLFNAVHFGLQNFGVLSLYKRNRKRDPVERCADMQLCLGVTISCTFLLSVWNMPPLVALALGMAFSVHHWMVEMALTSRAGGTGFLSILVVLALAGLLIYTPTPSGHSYQTYGHPDLISWIGSFAVGLSFVHFAYDRWIWKFSRRNVRETIGKSFL